MTKEELVACMILVLPLIISSVCLIYYLLKDRWKTELIMYYTIDRSSYGFYKITLWKSENLLTDIGLILKRQEIAFSH